MTTPGAPAEPQKKWITHVGNIGKVTAALLGIAALLALFGVKPPMLVPQPTPVSAVLSGKISDLSIEYDISYEEFMNRQNWSLDDTSDDQKQAVGAIVNFKSEIVGFTGQWCDVQWEIYDAVTQKRALASTEDLGISIKPDRETDRSSDFIWVAYPDVSGTYFARIELFDPKGQRLDYADTQPFDLTIED